MATDDRWFIRIRGQQQGPYTRDQLHVLIRRGQFGRMHEVSNDGKQWSRASTLADLFTSVRTIGAVQSPVVPIQPTQEKSAGRTEAPTLWYYARNDIQSGPVSSDELQSLASKGGLIATDAVWTEGMSDWQLARDVLLLQRIIPGAAPIPFAQPYTGPTDFVPNAIGRTNSPVASRYGAPIESSENSSVKASFVFGVLGWTILPWIGGCVAIFFGHRALAEVQRSDGRPGGRNRALTGLALGYTAVVIQPLIMLVIYFFNRSTGT